MSTENLVQALRDVLRAETEEADARARYDGYEWGYHGHQWAETSRKAGEAFQAALNSAIDARVSAAMAEVEVHRPRSGNA